MLERDGESVNESTRVFTRYSDLAAHMHASYTRNVCAQIGEALRTRG
jgi:hypothetical protein